jgi:hypothetical protein
VAILQNKFKIPMQIVSAIKRDPYNSGADISVTTVIQPPRIVQLRKRHGHEIVEDASDRIFALLGQTCHKVLERSDDSGAFHEERIWTEVDGWKVSGQTDCYVTQDYAYSKQDKSLIDDSYVDIPPTIRDYKLLKVMAGKFEHKDWEEQLNLNAYLWREHGFAVEKLEIVAIFRDWSKVLYERESDYPPAVKVYPQKLWTHEKATEFLKYRVHLHQAAAKLPDNMLPFCTPDEQWKRQQKWAVMKPKRKTAVKLFDSQEKAEGFISNQKGERTMYTEFRPSAPLRCQMYCDAAPFCNQYAMENPKPMQEAVNQ